MRSTHKQTSQDIGLTELLNKDVLPSLDFSRASPGSTPLHGIAGIAERQKQVVDDDDGDDDEDTQGLGENMGDSSELVGPAVDLQPQIESKKLRVGVKSRSAYQSPVAASLKATSEMADVRRNLNEALSRADTTVFEDADEMSDAAGDQVDHWKRKMPLQGVLQKHEANDKFERGTLKGMEKAYKRLLESKDYESNIVGNRLKAYHVNATELVCLNSGQVRVLADADYEKWQKVVTEEGLVLPGKFQKAVLSRRCAVFIAKQDWRTLLQCMSPFETAGEFEIARPKLADLSV
eukprot:2267834-Amphidinium_carterae.2